MKIFAVIVYFFFSMSYANPIGGALAVYGAVDSVADWLGYDGIQDMLFDNGVYVDEATGEMYWNGKNGEGQCYVKAIFDGKEKRFADKDAVCAYEMTIGDWSGWRLYQNLNIWSGHCEYETVPARWGGYYRGVPWQRVCPKSDDCKPFDDYASLDDEAYEYDESDAPFWERVKSKLSPDKGAELDDYLAKKKKGKKKKRKRKKKHDIDEEDDSACGQKFKREGKKRKKPKDDDDEEDEEKDDKDDKDDDKDKDDKDKDDKDKDDKDKKKKDKDDDDKDDDDKDDDDKDDDDKDDKDKKKKKDDDCSICELRKDLKRYDEEERGYRKEVLKELRKRNDDEFSKKEPELPKVKDKDYTQSKRINIEGRCPKPYVLNLQVGKVEFSYELICRYAELMRYFVLASAALMSAYILLGVARHG